MAQTDRLFATAGVEMLVSRARDVSKFPTYVPNAATYRKFASPTVPLLLLAGTLDPQTPHGLGAWYAKGLGENATLVTVPYAAHGTTNPDDMCVLHMVAEYLVAFGTKPANTTCLKGRHPPDFEGALPGTQDISLGAFGTADLWNTGFPRTSNTAPPTASTQQPPVEPVSRWNPIVVVSIAVVSAIAVAATIVLVLTRRRRSRLPLPAYPADQQELLLVPHSFEQDPADSVLGSDQ